MQAYNIIPILDVPNMWSHLRVDSNPHTSIQLLMQTQTHTYA